MDLIFKYCEDQSSWLLFCVINKELYILAYHQMEYNHIYTANTELYSA